MTILGKRKLNFTTKEGNHIDGVQFWITDKWKEKDAEGSEAFKVFLSKDRLAGLTFTPTVGSEVRVNFDRNGKFNSMELLSSFGEIE